MLKAAAGGPGTFCFRPSSKDANTIVLCVLVDNNNVANLRMKTADTGHVPAEPPPLATDNLLENTGGVGAPHQRSPGTGSLLPFHLC